MDQPTVYILLTRSDTWFSRLIHLATQDSYTHASIGLDGPQGPFYSFARKYEHFALPAGLVEERVGPEVREKRREVPCCLYELTVSQETYRRLRRRLSLMYAQREEYHYSVLGTLACFLWPSCFRAAARPRFPRSRRCFVPPTCAVWTACAPSTAGRWAPSPPARRHEAAPSASLISFRSSQQDLFPSVPAPAARTGGKGPVLFWLSVL